MPAPLLSKLVVASILFGIISVFSSCKKDPDIALHEATQARQYLHISHTRTDTNPAMDSLVEKIDYAAFDLLLLGAI